MGWEDYGPWTLAPAQEGANFADLEGATQRKSSVSGTLHHLREVQVKFPDTPNYLRPGRGNLSRRSKRVLSPPFPW